MRNCEELRTQLYSEAKDAALLKVADFIVWICESGNHEDIAGDFIEKKRTLSGVWKDIRACAYKKAVSNCAMVSAPEVYSWVAKTIGLQDCITSEEIDRYCLGEKTALDKEPFSEKSKTGGLDLGLDDLFG